mgnify:FL=1
MWYQDQRTVEERASIILRRAYGTSAHFRSHQLEAIKAVVAGSDSLLVQKTGWGKSLVYFIATKILRQDGAGPTLIISPLLALMENQIDSARLLGVEAATVNSDNRTQWDDIYSRLNDIDALIISPERLANERFMEQLARVRGIKLVVVDEAHAISDWGHDFRPDYQRVSRLINGLPGDVTVLGTTATANDRVIADIRAQMGDNLKVIRGDLIRENLAIQVNPPQTREQRLAWLVQALTEDKTLSKGQGIIYCLTHSDCLAVAEFLSSRGVSILPYFSGMGKDDRGVSVDKRNLESFVKGETRVLAATVKLGMGYDKSDIRFIIHFQLPQNLIAYYQQIGRAGRDGLPAYAFLLYGQKDDDILNYFIKECQSSPSLLSDIMSIVRNRNGARSSELQRLLNVKSRKINEALKYLMVHDYVYSDESVYRENIGKPFDSGREREKQEQLIRARTNELYDLREYLKSSDCYMRQVAMELDAPDAQRTCGICANCCGGPLVPVSAGLCLMEAAAWYLDNRHGIIEPRKRRATGGNIDKAYQMQTGWALYADYHSSSGEKVKEEKYECGLFSRELIRASADFLGEKVGKERIDCVVPIPSRRHPNLVPCFARELAKDLGIACIEAVEKTCDATEQKDLLNGVRQEENIRDSTGVVGRDVIRDRVVLLVDDMVDSRWTLTVVAAKLLEAGAMRVYPFALVKAGGGD